MTVDQIVAKLLSNRNLTSDKEIDEFFHPPSPDQLLSPIDPEPAIKLINNHISQQNKIAVYGDYDVDGICSTAILWETLYSNYKPVFPHIPHRESEGYGLSVKGIDHCLKLGAKLIIAVDNGIVAHKEVEYCRKQGCDIIVIDHHEPEKKYPNANVVLHSTSTCAAGLTWFFCRQWNRVQPYSNKHLDLVAIATICDLVPLTGLNRSIAKYGLEKLNNTSRPGLLSLFDIAGLYPGQIGTYHVGFIIGPRLNAMGRLEHAIDSLRLLCTQDPIRARKLAQVLNSTNQKRQVETGMAVTHAMDQLAAGQTQGILLAASTSYHSGVTGLISSKMTEHYYRPSIAISIGESESKGSGRSISGFHLTDFLRAHKKLFINLGGHSMACGFTIATDKIDDLAKILESAHIEPGLLTKKQKVDLDIPLTSIDWELSNQLDRFEPYGLGNPAPVFQSSGKITDIKSIGKEGKHKKFSVNGLEAVWFNAKDLLTSGPARLIYSISKNQWNGQEKLQLVVKSVYV